MTLGKDDESLGVRRHADPTYPALLMHMPTGTVLPVSTDLPFTQTTCLDLLEPGDRVSVVQGPLRGLTAIVVNVHAEVCLAEVSEGAYVRLPIASIAATGR